MLKRIDHVYLSVADFAISEAFYDRAMNALGQHKGDKAIAGEPHAHYLGPEFQLTIRPAKSKKPHDPYAPGLHHLCFQVDDAQTVDACFERLTRIGVDATKPKYYTEYNPAYYATFFEDPDHMRLEIVCKTPYRQALQDDWNDLEGFLNPSIQLPPKNAEA